MLNVFRFSVGSAAGILMMSLAAAQTPQTPASSASTNDAQARAVELLRQVIKAQQQHPEKIIRSPGDPSPARERETRETRNVPASGSRATRTELERQFLEGRISAKQYQRAIADLEKNPPSPAKTAVKETTSSPKAGAAKTASPPPAATNAATAPLVVAEDAPEQKALADVEAKIDEILSRREAQLQAAKTNATGGTNSVSAGPMTKRDKLNALLRQLIQGKITEAEYNAQREKLIAQPD